MLKKVSTNYDSKQTYVKIHYIFYLKTFDLLTFTIVPFSKESSSSAVALNVNFVRASIPDGHFKATKKEDNNIYNFQYYVGMFKQSLKPALFLIWKLHSVTAKIDWELKKIH